MAKEAFGVPFDVLAGAGIIPEVTPDTYSYTRFDGLSDLKRVLRVGETYGDYQLRDVVENDPTFGQLILYAFHVRPDGKFFMYQRGGVGAYDEERLAGQTSVGVGGHMERTDLSLASSIRREFGEEAHSVLYGQTKGYQAPDGTADLSAVRGDFRMQPLGVLRDVRKEVDRVHVGIVTRIHPRNPEMDLKIIEGGENVASKYVSLEEYFELRDSGQIEPENWTDAVIREEITPAIQAL